MIPSRTLLAATMIGGTLLATAAAADAAAIAVPRSVRTAANGFLHTNGIAATQDGRGDALGEDEPERERRFREEERRRDEERRLREERERRLHEEHRE